MIIAPYVRTLVAAIGLGGVVAVHAAPAPGAPDLGIMQGVQPAPDKQITHDNYLVPPNNRWSFLHVRELWPTRGIWRGDGPVTPLQEAPLPLDGFTTTVSEGRKLSLAQFLDESYTDGFVVLHRGRVVYERYFNGQQPQTQHLMFSVTKSFVSTIALTLIEEGKIDPARTVAAYLPELKDSAFGDATVQQVLDMTNAIAYSEMYEDPNADVWRYAELWQTPKPGNPQSIYEYLPAMKKWGEHGKGFHYVTPNTEVVAWIIRRVTGKPVDALISERLWAPLGTDRDGYIWVDGKGTEFTGGGLNVTARDAARFGQMIIQNGRYNGRQVLPEAVAKRILQPGKRETFMGFYGQFPGAEWYGDVTWAYHDMWWTFNNAHKSVSAVGVHGQYIFLDPKAEVVIVKQSSMPTAEGTRAQETDLPLMFHALAGHLMKLPAQ